jgi:protein SCO1/2
MPLGKNLRKRRWKLAEACLAALALISTGCAKREENPIPSGAIIRLSDAYSGQYALQGVDGRQVTQEDFRGKPVILYFGYTNCPDVCPVSIGLLAAALKQLSPEERSGLATVFVTVDPERDTPDALSAFLSIDPAIIGLTGTAEAAEAARKGFKIYAQKRATPDSALPYTMDHMDLFYLVGPDTKPVSAIRPAVTPEQLAAILRRAINGKFT